MYTTMVSVDGMSKRNAVGSGDGVGWTVLLVPSENDKMCAKISPLAGCGQ